MTEAKNEVMERKRDLDTTKEKMDKLVEKLYLGRYLPFLADPLTFAICSSKLTFADDLLASCVITV